MLWRPQGLLSLKRALMNFLIENYLESSKCFIRQVINGKKKLTKALCGFLCFFLQT